MLGNQRLLRDDLLICIDTSGFDHASTGAAFSAMPHRSGPQVEQLIGFVTKESAGSRRRRAKRSFSRSERTHSPLSLQFEAWTVCPCILLGSSASPRLSGCMSSIISPRHAA